MTKKLLVRAALPVTAICLLLAACSPAPPPALVPREVAPLAVVDPAAPCSREAAAPAGEAADAAKPAGIKVAFDKVANKITLNGGDGVTMAALSKAVNNPAALTESSPGEWLLGADLEILGGGSLAMAPPDVRWLKMSSSPKGYVSIKVLGGKLNVNGVCVTSWDTDKNTVDDQYQDGRAFLLARDGGQMNIDKSELRYLGHSETESYGLAWRLEGSGGGITNSIISHLYFGLYSFEVGGLVVTDNEVYSSVVYGIDPHTKSHNLQIQRNIVHDNGKHGIILAEDCVDSVISDNIVYKNQHHGIVLYLRSDRNRIENNETFGNLAQGININESSNNVVRSNRVYNNTESGIGIGQNASDNLVERNEIRGNEQDGVRLVSATSKADVRDNVIGENARYGVYIDAQGPFTLAGNTIFGSRAGVALNGTSPMPPGDNTIYKNTEIDVKSGS
jgi:parallel beta-helix repeat protein